MKLKPRDVEPTHRRERAGDVLHRAEEPDSRPFVVERDLKPRDWELCLKVVNEHKNNKRWINYAIDASQLALLYPQRVREFAVTDEVWKIMLEELETLRVDERRLGYFGIVAGSMNLLCPERVAELKLDDKTWRIVTSLLQKESANIKTFLEMSFWAKVLFPERIGELHLDKPQVVEWVKREYKKGERLPNVEDKFNVKMLFPQVYEEVGLPPGYLKRQVDLATDLQDQPHLIGGQACYLKLLVDDVELTPQGFLRVSNPRTRVGPPARPLPDRALQ